jgi:hypothetical protein
MPHCPKRAWLCTEINASKQSASFAVFQLVVAEDSVNVLLRRPAVSIAAFGRKKFWKTYSTNIFLRRLARIATFGRKSLPVLKKYARKAAGRNGKTNADQRPNTLRFLNKRASAATAYRSALQPSFGKPT